ncbi:MAG: hypothetical protein DRP08_02220 [Candidatus Aenigmatarchaeota archaeon]|nr:MAG: hypothetical protein DRP08_02220 [Candidatus Aenigmarchaeota archaeon]
MKLIKNIKKLHKKKNNVRISFEWQQNKPCYYAEIWNDKFSIITNSSHSIEEAFGELMESLYERGAIK